jgi:hypothetical protein
MDQRRQEIGTGFNISMAIIGCVVCYEARIEA